MLLEAVDAGAITLEVAVAALTTGPARVLATDRASDLQGLGRLVEGEPADFVVFDRSSRWTVDATTLRTNGFGYTCSSAGLPGEVILTVARGRLAHEADTAR